MNTSRIFISILAVGAAGLLSSCVDPYYGGTTTTVTHYRPGYMVDTLPGGYRTEVIGGVSYYRHNDVYYRPQGRRYVVVDRPGSHNRGPVRRDDRYDLRDDRRDNHYDRHDDRRDNHYDRRDDRRDSHFDSRRPGPGSGRTSVIRTLPGGARTVNHRGVSYYESRGTYYRPTSGGYVIVGSPF